MGYAINTNLLPQKPFQPHLKKKKSAKLSQLSPYPAIATTSGHRRSPVVGAGATICGGRRLKKGPFRSPSKPTTSRAHIKRRIPQKVHPDPPKRRNLSSPPLPGKTKVLDEGRGVACRFGARRWLGCQVSLGTRRGWYARGNSAHGQ